MGLHNGRLSAQWIPDGQSTLNGNSWNQTQAILLCAEATSRGKSAVLCVGSANTAESWNANLDTPAKRAQIAVDIADTIVTCGYSGVDLDGEPGGAISNMRLFWQAIIVEFSSRGWRTAGLSTYKTISLACFGAETQLAKNAVADGFDWVTPMLYVPYELTSRHISPLSGSGDPWEVYVNLWSSGAGAIPVKKILPGMSYYAFSWLGVAGPNQVASSRTGDQDWAIVNSAIGGVMAPNADWYSDAQMHGMVIGGSWYSFETDQSVAAKAAWVRANDVGGTAIWMYQHGSLGGNNHPLAASMAAHFGSLL